MDDIAAPAPGRKVRVMVGQVGVRCTHCARLTPKERVKRAICYPPTVSGIYHSISNMKFDHFGSCKGLSQESRAEFVKLKQQTCHRRGTPAVLPGGAMPNSTAQYYHDSAIRLGLMDTNQGIRLRQTTAVSDGISALMIAATNPSIRADFEYRKSTGAAVKVTQ
eukprot:CAMPEP_0118716826 /NCGR_PEP_ID=MMETSP0800-20121206/27742_1 /TAXON_ID=210618 ORGANISM="Striatella unipunctata, Strain CCMP2910" /NCGR_SAMPLE_ID=MMETSP0800 /ASSEMBLY_ACC=CAM_ASM_000638 /LENGTH=163 /DNA_ID=CAMNT_0006623341 /DNA_START=299 /DNA_END=790 /DNA_ORIENTATION=-